MKKKKLHNPRRIPTWRIVRERIQHRMVRLLTKVKVNQLLSKIIEKKK